MLLKFSAIFEFCGLAGVLRAAEPADLLTLSNDGGAAPRPLGAHAALWEVEAHPSLSSQSVAKGS